MLDFGGAKLPRHEARTVWKYQLDRVQNTLTVPEGSLPLHVGYDVALRTPVIWIEVPDQRVEGPSEMVEREFIVYGTGHQQKDSCHAYIGTVVDDSVGMVWHVYETHDHTPEEEMLLTMMDVMLGGG